MNIALMDKEKRVYILKHLVYNSQTKEYFNMIKFISNNNEMIIGIIYIILILILY